VHCHHARHHRLLGRLPQLVSSKNRTTLDNHSLLTIENSTAYKNSTTAVAPTTVQSTNPVGTISATATKATSLPTAGAGKAAALSGAGLAGLLGLAVFIL
jgi:hypothetical protein